MPAIDEFRAHPRTFMRANIVMVSAEGGAAKTGGIRTLSFSRSTGNTARNMLAGGAEMPVYALGLPPKANNPTIDVWWCPFGANDTLGTNLPGTGGPDVMFTYAMDGCTFVAGSVAMDKSVQVHHVNMTRSGGALGSGSTPEQRAEQQRKMQRNVSRSLVTNAKLVDPDDYYDPSKARVVVPQDAKIATVTFGRRTSKAGWKFYTHQWYTVAGARTALCFMGTQRVI